MRVRGVIVSMRVVRCNLVFCQGDRSMGISGFLCRRIVYRLYRDVYIRRSAGVDRVETMGTFSYGG